MVGLSIEKPASGGADGGSNLRADFNSQGGPQFRADYQMTSNRPLEDWGKLIGDVPSATAILDRFLHHAEIITITGRSYRLKDRGGQNANADGEPTPKDGADREDNRGERPNRSKKKDEENNAA